MFEQLARLEDMECSLSRALSLTNATSDYFRYDDPDEALLKVRYRMYGDINGAVMEYLRNK